ncbi:hypothetical protein LX99_03612 [Mucilaginibacter oryzae]|uniref:Uncharacterized protein n=1 Tax=Mucilaginibacter oryzae TaxID=468058 RepID=A0A316H487_9SPHI|nr:hypothetical protein [Mucilaginibacter oryzae]PWK75879.1 hypothetical protein LX99_03612 [Mucilaginibacter oryzae]
MLLSLIEIILFLAVIVLAVAGPPKRRKQGAKTNPDAQRPSAYRVTPNGVLEYVDTDR